MRGIQFRWMWLCLLVLMMVLLSALAHAAPPAQGEDRKAQADALLVEGGELYKASKYQAALEKFQAALKIYREIGDRQSEGLTIGLVGVIYKDLGQYQESLKYYQESLTIFRELGDREWEGSVLSDIGIVYVAQGQHQEALRHLREALIIFEELGDQQAVGQIGDLIEQVSKASPTQEEDREAQADALLVEGIELVDAGEYQTALEKIQAALKIYRKIGEGQGEGVALYCIGNVYVRLRQYQEAMRYLREALAVYEELDDQQTMRQISDMIEKVSADALLSEGLELHKAGKYQAALEKFQTALKIYGEIDDRKWEGATHNNIGMVYGDLGQYQQALEYCQEALAISREIGDREGEGRALNSVGNVYMRLGQYQEALKYYKESLAIFRELGGREEEGGALGNIGNIYESLGQYQDALEYYKEALAISREISDRAGEGGALSNIGNVYWRMGQYQEALKHCQEALAICREIRDRAMEGQTLGNIGAVYASLGQYQEALKYNEESLAIKREIGDRAGEGQTLGNIGAVYTGLGQHQEALKYFKEALAICREIGYREGEGGALNNIGMVYYRLSQYQEALKYYEESLAIKREVGDRAGEGNTLSNIGAVYRYLGQYQEALKYYEESLAIYREIGGRAGEGAVLNNIGEVYKELGQYQEALKYLEEALAIKREVGDRAREGSTLANIGEVYRGLGQYQEALRYFEDALVIVREVGDRGREGSALGDSGNIYADLGQYQEALRYFEDALVIFREVGDRWGEAITLGHIGACYYYAGEKEKALEYCLETLAVYEEIRGVMTVEELKTAYAGTYKKVYEVTISLLMELNRPREAFHYSERARARTLLDQLGNAHIDPRKTDDPALLEQEESLRLEIGALEGSLREEWAKPKAQRSDEAIKNLTVQLEKKRKEYAKLLEKLKLKNPEYASLVTVDPLTLEQIQELLTGVTLVEYFLTEEQIFAFIIGKDDFQVETIEVKREDLQEAMTTFHDFASLEGTPDEMKSLYDTLFAPVRPHIKTGALIIAPHGLLHYLPFHALHDGEHYLVEVYTITYIPSASVLPFALEKRKEGPDTGSVLVLGNPTVQGVPPLAYAEREAQEVADLYGAIPHYEEEATETLFRGEAGTVALVHMACHGEYNPYVPLFSRLLLAADGEHDGYLHVYELYNIELPQADLVTLSACQTNVGQMSEGDEVIGLSRALIYAGAPTIVTSLWTVDDVATGELMVSFYKHLKEGKNKAEALRAAQVEMLGKGEYAHPYYWAAFVLSGDGGQVSEMPLRTSPAVTAERRSRIYTGIRLSLIFIGAGVLLFVGTVGALRLRRGLADKDYLGGVYRKIQSQRALGKEKRLANLYARLEQAMGNEQWARAVHLCEKIQAIVPHYRDVAAKWAQAHYQAGKTNSDTVFQRPGWIRLIALLQFFGAFGNVVTGFKIVGDYTGFGILLIVLAITFLATGIGLWQMRNWGRIGTIIVRGFDLLFTLIFMSSPLKMDVMSIVALVISILIILYLLFGTTASEFD